MYVDSAVVGNRIGDIGAAIQEYAESRGRCYVIWLGREAIQLCTKSQWFLTTYSEAVGPVSVKKCGTNYWTHD